MRSYSLALGRRWLERVAESPWLVFRSSLGRLLISPLEIISLWGNIEEQTEFLPSYCFIGMNLESELGLLKHLWGNGRDDLHDGIQDLAKLDPASSIIVCQSKYSQRLKNYNFITNLRGFLFERTPLSKSQPTTQSVGVAPVHCIEELSS